MYEGSLCVCCMSTDDLLDLFASRTVHNSEENYAKMLTSCLNIQIKETDGHDSICENCIKQLKNCVAFKRQAIKTISIISSVCITKLVNEDDIKVLGLVNPDKLEDEEKKPTPVLYCPQREHACEDIETKNEFATETKLPSKRKPARPRSTIASQTSQGTTTGTEKAKVGRGRPRKFPPDYIPYKVGKDELICRECGEVFPNNMTLKVHYNTHFRNHICGVCDKGFITLMSLRKHEQNHLVGPFQCEVCGEEFRKKNTLQSHKRLKHGAALPFRCAVCAAQFATATRRRAHAAAAHLHTEARHPCRYCGVRFMHSGERSKHIATHHEVKLFPCPFCGVKYRRRYLRAHVRRKHGFGPGWACTVCDAICPTRSALRQHMTTHFGIRRFSCRLCSKSYTQKCSLKYHIRTHLRRGEYSGDPDGLIAQNDAVKEHIGILENTQGAAAESSSERELTNREVSQRELSEDITFELDLPSDIEEF